MPINVVRPRQIALELLQRHRVRLVSTSATRPARRRHIILEGRHTNVDSPQPDPPNESPFYIETGYSVFAKRPSRPFPPPFVSAPSGSFSDPLTTHDRAKYRQPKVDGKYLKGITNGDDAIVISNANFLAVNDGVGAWAQKERGHAALWSRLIAHYWAGEVDKVFEKDPNHNPDISSLKPIQFLQTAFEKTKQAVQKPAHEILGTTTASSALLHHKDREPIVLATQLGDCAIFIIRPSNHVSENEAGSDHDNNYARDTDHAHSEAPKSLIYKTKEQWHWFDCPRQVGTNSPDSPTEIAITDEIPVQPSDIILAMSDGVTDNLWEHEITTKICETYADWKANKKHAEDGIVYMARELMNAARVVAEDPYAESPYMERALDEGIAAEGGKLDDISVVIGIVRKRQDDDKEEKEGKTEDDRNEKVMKDKENGEDGRPNEKD